MLFQRILTVMPETSKIALATLDGEVYYRVVQELKNRKTRFIVRKPWETIPLSVKAVITTENEFSQVKHHTVLICEKDDVEETVSRAINMISGPISQPCRVMIGVDPGKTIGFAVISERLIFKTSNYSKPQEILKAITQAVKDLTPKELVIKIGGGSGSQRFKRNSVSEELSREIERLAESLTEEFNLNVKVIFVDESYTTAIAKRRRVKRRDKDKTSAVEIALR